MGGVVSNVIGGIGQMLGMSGKPEMPATPAPPPPPAREDAAVASQQAQDAMRRRRGAAASILTSSAGATGAPTGKKTLLGS